jgi:hypothetical protein
LKQKGKNYESLVIEKYSKTSIPAKFQGQRTGNKLNTNLTQRRFGPFCVLFWFAVSIFNLDFFECFTIVYYSKDMIFPKRNREIDRAIDREIHRYRDTKIER